MAEAPLVDRVEHSYLLAVIRILLEADAERMDIRLVELYTNVVDRSGKPVEGIGPRDLQVLEDGSLSAAGRSAKCNCAMQRAHM